MSARNSASIPYRTRRPFVPEGKGCEPRPPYSRSANGMADVLGAAAAVPSVRC